MKEITIKEIFSMLRKRILYLIIIPLVVLIAAIIILAYQPNYYSAQTKLYVLMEYVDTTGQTRYDTSVSAQFAGDFKELIKTPQVIEAAENALGNALDLKRDVNFDVSAVIGTRVLNITATSKFPTLSVLAANTISRVFVDYIAEMTKTNSITIASEAVLPDGPSGPGRWQIAIIAYALSLFLLSAFFVALEVLNTTLRTSEEVEAKLGLPVLANIEDYRKKLKAFFHKNGAKHTVSDYVSSITREGVKTLATNIEFSFSGRAMESIMITSTLSNEGKSSLSILLAEAMANEGYHVLIVDADFRKPSIGKYLGIRNKYDLIDYIFEDISLEDILVRTHHQHLDFVDSVHKFASTSQIFNYKKFDQFLEEAKQRYDIILFDTPPLGLFIDAALLARKVSGTLLVVGKGLAESERAKDVVTQLQKADTNFIGVALNYTNLYTGSKYYNNKYYGRYNMD